MMRRIAALAASWGFSPNAVWAPGVSREAAVSLGGSMAARRKKAASGGDLIISKARTKAAVKKCNVGGEFYGALDKAVREIIKEAEGRALGNKRKTLKAVDI